MPSKQPSLKRTQAQEAHTGWRSSALPAIARSAALASIVCGFASLLVWLCLAYSPGDGTLPAHASLLTDLAKGAGATFTVLGVLTYFFFIDTSADRENAKAGLILLTSLALLIVLRDPTLFTQPRFWAEEAVIYFRTAWLESAGYTVFAPHQGYLSLFANLAGLMATWVPLEYAPTVTTLLAALAQLGIMGAIVLTSAKGLHTWIQKSWATLAALIVGANAEIWLTTINTQHWLPLLIFLILIDGKETPAKRGLWYATAVFAGLSGVAANFLGPLFLVRYLRQRDKADLNLFIILTITACVQLAAIAYSALVLGSDAYYHPSQSRTLSNADIGAVLDSIYHYGVGYPLFGEHWRLVLIAPWLLMGICALAWRTAPQLAYHYAALALLTILTVLGSLGMRGGGRYAYPGAVIVSLMLIQITTDSMQSMILRRLTALVFLMSLLIWAREYQPSLKYARDPNWPAWAVEVQRWRDDPTHALQAHPAWPAQDEIGLRWAVKPPPKP